MHISKYAKFGSNSGWEKTTVDKITGEEIGCGYLKYPRDSRNQKSLKKQSRKKVRKQSEIPNGNGYRKCFDYWWNLS